MGLHFSSLCKPLANDWDSVFVGYESHVYLSCINYEFMLWKGKGSAWDKLDWSHILFVVLSPCGACIL